MNKQELNEGKVRGGKCFVLRIILKLHSSCGLNQYQIQEFKSMKLNSVVSKKSWAILGIFKL